MQNNKYEYTKERQAKDLALFKKMMRVFFTASKFKYGFLRNSAIDSRNIRNNKIERFWKCASCTYLFEKQSVEVDHKIPVEVFVRKKLIGDFDAGNIRNQMNKMIIAFFCPEHLQILCKTCHAKKTIEDNRKIKKLKDAEK